MRLIRSLAAAPARHGRRALWRRTTRRAFSDTSDAETKIQLLPEHIKFRMPDLEFEVRKRWRTGPHDMRCMDWLTLGWRL